MTTTDDPLGGHEQRVRALLRGQTAPRAGHGVRVLWRCRTCGYPWLQDGRLAHGARVRLAHAEAAQYAAALGARLDDLPVGAHLLGAVFALRWAERLALHGQEPQAGIVTAQARLRAVLAWLARLPIPPRETILAPDQGALVARGTPPGHGAEGTEGWIWRGVLWPTACPPLGGLAVVSLAEAVPPAMPWSLEVFTLTWRSLAAWALQSADGG